MVLDLAFWLNRAAGSCPGQMNRPIAGLAMSVSEVMKVNLEGAKRLAIEQILNVSPSDSNYRRGSAKAI